MSKRAHAPVNVESGPAGYWYRILSNGRRIKTGYDVGDYPTEELAAAVIGPGSYRDFLHSVAFRLFDKMVAAINNGTPGEFTTDETEAYTMFGVNGSQPLLSIPEQERLLDSFLTARRLVKTAA